MYATYITHLIFTGLITLAILAEEYKLYHSGCTI
jgi:hypothetical protein